MGNKTEEAQIEKDLDKLDEEEIKINLEIYKLQTEVNNRKPEDQQIKLKENYIEIINKFKSKKNKKESDKEIEQENEKNKKNKKKNKIKQLKKRLKELENINKEDEEIEIIKNKDKIKNELKIQRDYLKELNEVEQELLEEDVKEDIIKNINKNLDTPDINENLLNDKMSELYNNADNQEYSMYEENYSNDYELYKNIVKDNNLNDKLDEIKVKLLEPGEILNNEMNDKKHWKKGRNDKYNVDYIYEVKRNKIIEKALEKRNHIVKNRNILKEDNSPYSDYQPSEKKSDNISQYY